MYGVVVVVGFGDLVCVGDYFGVCVCGGCCEVVV